MNSYNDSGSRVPKQKRILIIDDEEDVTISLRVALEHNGFKTDSYTDPVLAYKNFRYGFYDLVSCAWISRCLKLMDFTYTKK